MENLDYIAYTINERFKSKIISLIKSKDLRKWSL